MNKIILLIALCLSSCEFRSDNNILKIKVSEETQMRVQELIDHNIVESAGLFSQPNSKRVLKNNFTHLDSQYTGINFKNLWNPDSTHRDQLENSFIAAGVAIGDFDKDGLPDIFLSRMMDGGRLYKNLGGMRFADVTYKVGILKEDVWSTGASFVDINNDGWLDLYICAFDGHNQLFINYEGKFKDSAKEYGLDFKGASVSMAFSDYDNDGDLDAYLLTNRLEMNNDEVRTKIIKNKNGKLEVHPDHKELGYFLRVPGRVPDLINAGQYDYLYMNESGYFVDVTQKSGIGKNPYYGLSSTWWDFNSDGKPDLYVANDFMGPDHLFENMGKNKDGITQFTDIIKDAMPYTPWFSMGSDYSDINNDGRMDFMASDMAGSNHYRDKLSMGAMSGPDSHAWFLNFPNPPQYMRNMVYLNTGTKRFMEVAHLSGLATTDWTWSVKFGDLDNDGYEDVYFTNGMSRDFGNGDKMDSVKKNISNKIDYWDKQSPYNLSNLVFKNLGNLQFKDVSSNWGLDYSGVSTGSALGDLDGDGDLDIVMNGFNESVRIYRNNIAGKNVIRIILEGKQSNKNGIGARVELKYNNNSKSLLRYLSSSRGFMSSSESVIHFGLGIYEKADKITIKWPSGNIQVLENIPTGYVYTISEKNNSIEVDEDNVLMFTKDTGKLSEIQHREKYFDDFKRENLLPNKLSQLGSGVSWGDIDGDGDNDVYVGGASGFPGRIYVNNESGGFTDNFQLVFNNDAKYEDMGSIFIDPDGDGDLDLFVVSGGVECQPGDKILQDRLYLNDGYGRFSRAVSSLLPKMNDRGSIVAAADINKDGKLELFIGGRVVPGSYPEEPRSYLLTNSGPRFVDATEDMGPELKRAGMVTSALFSDVDGDNWVDLLVTYEWGSIRFFHNESGILVDRTANTGLDDKLGWFNSISSGDIDNDGDTDFIVGNTGYNTKYKATSTNPEILYYGDFEGSGKKHIVEAKFEQDVCFPRRGLGCSSSAMPMIKEKFPTYHDFATSSLQDIYTDELLNSADKYEVNELASGIIENRTDNEGNIMFVFRPLPRVVQSSPIFGSALSDVNGDGNIDLYVVQNFSGPQRETGYMHGGVSQLMLGDGAGNFEPISPSVSGLVVPGDAKSLTMHDLNNDGRVDFFVGVNNGKLESFVNQIDTESYALKLTDFPRGKRYIGSKIWVHFNDNSVQLHEVFAGGGYLSQSAPIIFIGNLVDVQKVVIQWPDGTKEETDNYKSMIGLSSL